MVQVRWTDPAFDRLADIARHIAPFNSSAAERTVMRIVGATRRLTEFPESGRIVPEYGLHTVREIIVRPYRIVYRLRGDLAEIVAVRHGARQLGDLPEF